MIDFPPGFDGKIKIERFAIDVLPFWQFFMERQKVIMQENQTSNPSKSPVSLNNSVGRMAWKTILNIWVITIISLIIVLSFSPLMVQGVWGKLLTLLFTMILTFAILYGYMWSQGDRDANFIQFGRDTYDKWKGLKVGLLALLPNLLWDLLLLLSMVRVLPIDFLPFYRMLNAPLWPLINMIHAYGAIPYDAVAATETMEAIEATAGLSWGGFVGMCLLPLIYTAFCVLGYYLGHKRISIRSKMIYEDPKKKAERERKRRERDQY